MFGRDSAGDDWREFRGWSIEREHYLARRKAMFHHRHLIAVVREWAVTLMLVSVSLWLAALAVFVVLR